MMEWMRFLYKFPQAFIKIHQDDDNSICRYVTNANQAVNTIGHMIQTQADELEVSKQVIERKLFQEKQEFVINMNETHDKVDKL